MSFAACKSGRRTAPNNARVKPNVETWPNRNEPLSAEYSIDVRRKQYTFASIESAMCKR